MLDYYLNKVYNKNMKQFTIFSNALGVYNYTLLAYERSRYMGDWKSILHSHSYMEILFISDGEGFLRIPGKDTHIHKGMIVIINPLTLHTEISHWSNNLEYACFSIGNIIFQQEKTEHKDVFFFDFSREFETLFDVLRVIEREEVEKKPFWEFAVRNEVNKFLLYILRNTSLISQPYDSNEKPDVISNIHLYLTSRFQDEITLDKLSEIFYLNKYYISHAFKAKYGKSIIAELIEIRCNEAEHLLKSTNMSIGDISANVGFNSVAHFSNTYKKIKGQTPEQAKKSSQKI